MSPQHAQEKLVGMELVMSYHIVSWKDYFSKHSYSLNRNKTGPNERNIAQTNGRGSKCCGGQYSFGNGILNQCLHFIQKLHRKGKTEISHYAIILETVCPNSNGAPKQDQSITIHHSQCHEKNTISFDIFE